MVRESLSKYFVSETGCKDMISLYYTRRYLKFPPPINMMFISRQPRYIPPNFYPLINDLKEIGYNLIFPFPLDSPQEASSTRVKCLWKEFLLAGLCLSSSLSLVRFYG